MSIRLRSDSTDVRATQRLLEGTDLSLRRALALGHGFSPRKDPDGKRRLALVTLGEAPDLDFQQVIIESFLAEIRARVEGWGRQNPVTLAAVAILLSTGVTVGVTMTVSGPDDAHERAPTHETDIDPNRLREELEACGVVVPASVLGPSSDLRIDVTAPDGQRCRLSLRNH